MSLGSPTIGSTDFFMIASLHKTVVSFLESRQDFFDNQRSMGCCGLMLSTHFDCVFDHS